MEKFVLWMIREQPRLCHSSLKDFSQTQEDNMPRQLFLKRRAYPSILNGTNLNVVLDGVTEIKLSLLTKNRKEFYVSIKKEPTQILPKKFKTLTTRLRPCPNLRSVKSCPKILRMTTI